MVELLPVAACVVLYGSFTVTTDGRYQAVSVSNGICSQDDMLPYLEVCYVMLTAKLAVSLPKVCLKQVAVVRLVPD